MQWQPEQEHNLKKSYAAGKMPLPVEWGAVKHRTKSEAGLAGKTNPCVLKCDRFHDAAWGGYLTLQHIPQSCSQNGENMSHWNCQNFSG